LGKTYLPNVINGPAIQNQIEITTFLTNAQPTITYNDGNDLTGTLTGEDYFELLCTLRSIASSQGKDILCQGSLINVYPGGLASDQSLGEIAQKYDSNKKTFGEVAIFSPASASDIKNIALPEDQKAHRRKAI